MSAHTTLEILTDIKPLVDDIMMRLTPHLASFAADSEYHLSQVLLQPRRRKDIWHSHIGDSEIPELEVPGTYLSWSPQVVLIDFKNKTVQFQQRSMFNRTATLNDAYIDQSILQVLGLMVLIRVFNNAGFSVM